MVHTDEIRTGSRSLVRRQDDRERSVLFYTLRRFKKSQRQGGPGRQKGEDRGIPVGVSRGTGGEHVGPTPALTVIVEVLLKFGFKLSLSADPIDEHTHRLRIDSLRQLCKN